MLCFRKLVPYYEKTQKNCTGARNRTNINVNLLVPKPKTRWREIRVRRYRVSWGPLYLLMFKRAHCLWVSDLHFYSRRNFTHGRLKFFENYQLKYYFGPKKITFLKRVWICAVFWFLFWQNWIVKWNCQMKLSNRYR